MAPTKDEEEDSDLAVDSSGIQGQGMPDDMKVNQMETPELAQNKLDGKEITDKATNENTGEDEKTENEQRKVPESSSEDKDSKTQAIVETVVTVEELESGTISDVVTYSGTGSQRDQWVRIGDRIEKQKAIYDAIARVHLAFVLDSPVLQKLSPLFKRQVTHRRVKRREFIFKDQKGCEVLEVTPTQWKQLKDGEVYEVKSIRRNRPRQKKQTLASSGEVTKDQGRPMETAKVIPDSDEENQPGLKDVMQRQQLLQHQELEIDMQESQRQEQELRFEAKKQEQRKAEMELQKYDIELQRLKQELQDARRDSEFQAKKREQEFQVEVKKQIFLHERRDKQLAFMQDGHELYMMQQRDLANKLREQHQDLASRQREIDKYMCAEQE